jgi:hypothetical protein
MPRNVSGTYTLPIAPFTSLGLIKASDHNSNYGDIATALTQSLATTGVSSMTGALKAAAGSVGAPAYTFSSDLTTGFYLAGSHQIGWSANGVQGATFNSDLSVTWAGAQSIAGTLTAGGNLTINSTTVTFGAGAAAAFQLGLGQTAAFEVLIDGAGSVITTGVKGFIEVPFACQITRLTLGADQSGSIGVDIWRANAAVPTAAGIIGFSSPSLVSQQYSSTTNQNSTTLAARDILAFNVSSASTVLKVLMSVTVMRTGN